MRNGNNNNNRSIGINANSNIFNSNNKSQSIQNQFNNPFNTILPNNVNYFDDYFSQFVFN